MNPEVKFEIRVQKDNRWEIHSVVPRDQEAVMRAEALVASGQYDAVEVVRDRIGSDGLSTEKVVFSQAGVRKDKTINVAPLDDAPVCESVEQVYDAPARQAMGRVLREFLDAMVLTPTELLHTARALGKLNDADALLPSAIDRVAKIQVRKAGGAVKARADWLFAAFEKVSDRARLKNVPEIDATFGALVATVEAAVRREDRRQVIMTALTRRLASAMVWEGKLDIVLALLDDETLNPWSAALLDSVAAEILDSPTALHEIVGDQPDLGTRIGALIGLSRGIYTPRKWDPPILVRLAAQLAARPMPACRGVLGERVARELASRAPLTRGGPKDEEKALAALLRQLVDGHVFVGGRETLDGFTRRFARPPAPSADPKTPEETLGALLGVIEAVVNPVYKTRAKIQCVLDLADTPFGRACAPVLDAALTALTATLTEIYDLTYYRLPVHKRMIDIADLQRAAIGCGLKGKSREALIVRLDVLQCAFIDTEQIIAKLDNPQDNLSQRAIRLLQFCVSGVLTETMARARVTEAVLNHLRQPNFIEIYTQGVTDSAQRDDMIRKLHKLVAAAGVQI